MFVTVEEASLILGCSTRTIMARCNRDELPSYLKDGRRLVWAKKNPVEIALGKILDKLEALENERGADSLTAQNTKPAPARKARAAERKRTSQPLRIEGVISGDDAELLNGLSELEMSAHKIEKAAGTWNGVISKLRKGKLSPGNVKARAALRAFLNSRQDDQAKTA